MSGFLYSVFKSWKSWILIYLVLTCLSSLYLHFSGETAIEMPEQVTPSVNWILISGFGQEREIWNQFLHPDSGVVVLPAELSTPQAHNLAGYSVKDTASLVDIYFQKTSSIRLVAYGFGTVIAAELGRKYPDKISSLTLINPIGISEYEALGGTHLNKALYTAKAFLEWGRYYLIPHFGLLTKQRYYRARAFMKTDFREVRKNYQLLNLPVTIIVTDELGEFNYSVALEIHRLIPQSDLVEVSDSPSLINAIHSKGEYPHQSIIRREVQSRLPFSNEHVVRAEGWVLAGLMLLIIFSTFISEDLACIGAGLLAARGILSYWPAMFAGLIGIFVGDILLYLAGRWLGAEAVRKAPFKWFITQKDLEKSYYWFEAKGPMIIIASRFIPGTRFPTYVSAGIIGASFWTFILYFGVASLLWTPALVGLAMLIGQELIGYFYVYQEYAIWVLIGIVLLNFSLIKVFIPMLTYRGRRLLYGKLLKLTKWEFWPVYVLYTPVVFYLCFLWIKHRSITVFAAANPGIEEGGFKGESKSGILQNIKEKDFVARFTRIGVDHDIAKRLQYCRDFMHVNSLEFPVVLKPDVGERGKGVYIIHDENDLEQKLSLIEEDYLLQEYVSGEEYGVFYYRYPDLSKGQIFSITKKELLTIKGDGKHTLEYLILHDPRAIYLAELHLDKHYDHLYSIPDKGEELKLVELGTHSRGARFFDASELITPELCSAIDSISRSFEGFYFGRFDLKVPSAEDLRKGRNIKIIELNGVTSESTNIYDPKYSFIDAVKILARQWKIAFEIGEANRNKGIEAPSVAQMIARLRN